MKIEPNSHNPLKLVLEYLDTAGGKLLTQDVLDHVKAYLELGGVYCETEGEVMACLALMHNLEMINLIETEHYYEVYTTYGK